MIKGRKYINNDMIVTHRDDEGEEDETLARFMSSQLSSGWIHSETIPPL